MSTSPTDTTTAQVSSDSAIWDDIAKYGQLITSSAGIILNMIVFVTFTRVRNIVPPTTRVLMIHQCYLELLSSGLGIMAQQTQNLDIRNFQQTGSV